MTLLKILAILTLIMADPVWGMLGKALDDNQTIDQAIAAAIATHEADSEAHTGANESLETHKTQEIVDHPAGSIVMDKFSAQEDYHFTDFQSLAGWTIAGVVENAGWPGVTLDIIDGETEVSSLYATALVPGGYLRKDHDAQIQVTMYADTVANAYAVVFGFGATGLTPAEGFGFKKDGTSLKGYVRTDSTTTYTSELTPDMASVHVYRAYYNGATDEVEFYIDGDLVATVARPAGTWNMNGIPEIYAKAQTEESGVIKVLSLEFFSNLLQ
jgi:hypothetical protein